MIIYLMDCFEIQRGIKEEIEGFFLEKELYLKITLIRNFCPKYFVTCRMFFLSSGFMHRKKNNLRSRSTTILHVRRLELPGKTIMLFFKNSLKARHPTNHFIDHLL